MMTPMFEGSAALLPCGGVVFEADGSLSHEPVDWSSPVLRDANTVFDLERFKTPRRPFSLGKLTPQQATCMAAALGATKITDMPIRFPGSNFRVPQRYVQFVPILQRVANFERRINRRCFDEYYCYLTVHQTVVPRGRRQRPSPCHVDGFQGMRWRPKVRGNRSYVVANELPTVFHEQSFDLSHLDEAKHNFFFEMDRQVQAAGGKFAWQPEQNELVMMDCYCVHQGACAVEEVWRTFLRISFEVRQFDHIDNAHNPLFDYDWPMFDRHIGKLGLSVWTPG